MKFDNYKHMEEVIKSCSLRYKESLYKEIISSNFQHLRLKGNNCFEDMITHNSYYARKNTQETQNNLCEKNYFSLEGEEIIYGISSFKELKITNEIIEVVEASGRGIIKQKIVVDYKTNEISNVEFEYYDGNAAQFFCRKYDNKMDLCNNLEQITKEYEILCDFKVGIIRNRINKEQDKVNIQLTSGDNFNLYNRIFWCKNKPNFYYFAKYFLDELCIPEFFSDKDLSKILKKINTCEYFCT